MQSWHECCASNALLLCTGDGEAARPLWALLTAGGPEALAKDRQGSVNGREREGAVLAGLQLLRCAFERDQAASAVLSLGSGGSGRQHLSGTCLLGLLDEISDLVAWVQCESLARCWGDSSHDITLQAGQ